MMFSLEPTMNKKTLDSAIDMANDILKKKAQQDQQRRAKKTKKKYTKTSSSSAAAAPTSKTPRKKLSSNKTNSTVSCSSKEETKQSQPIVNLATSNIGVESSSRTKPRSKIHTESKENDDNLSVLTSNTNASDCALSATSQPENDTLSMTSSTHSRSDFYFQHSIVVDKMWQNVKKNMVDYESKIGEQILLRMMEIDSGARKAMRITSLRSDRFDELTKMLVVVVDLMVSVFGPDIDIYEEDLEQLGHECMHQGIKLSLLKRAVPDALQVAIADEDTSSSFTTALSTEDHESWSVVVETVLQEMDGHVDE